MDSFTTQEAISGRGTVTGHANTFSTPCGTAGRYSTCAATCSSGDPVFHTDVC